ncbi:CinA family nicotinamide mononucleotide deamidase-related protein [Blastopirellula marina]|uniref:CinA-like protein n=1 Tax=Blastopirellula marina TaxID=124 RepID=A0A2S8G0D9_9BACT|nr:CinA family nicotinamide mononucleotide deamidase-related protein [Blastopirellula marina]PQO37909.1 competence/damage-inducible protein A [Blastopirellula marina]PTL44565.1 competence/damage-inducible protein A [Blastopirellula marina]
MFAEILAIGDELTSGQRLDTNTQWLSQQLEQLGIEVRFHTTIGDDLASNVQAFRIALSRAALVIATGGLGPTDDDLTRQALAEATGTELKLHGESLEHIERRFSMRGRQMPPKNQIQAMFPQGSRVIPNPNGTAPGIDLDCSIDGHASRFIALPGVPAEMKEMWQATVVPSLAGQGTVKKIIRHHVVKCFGVGESHMEALLPDLIKRGREPRVGITVHQATISLRITATGANVRQCETAIDDTVQQIHAAVGDLVFGEGEDELQDVVVRQLHEQNKTLATVESSTAGMLAFWLGSVDEQRTALVAGSILPLGELVTQEQVKDAAATAREANKTDFALALGTFCDAESADEYAIALAGPDGVEAITSGLAGHPEIWGPRMAKQGLDLLRKKLLHP